jgi:hypothetical protein
MTASLSIMGWSYDVGPLTELQAGIWKNCIYKLQKSIRLTEIHLKSTHEGETAFFCEW